MERPAASPKTVASPRLLCDHPNIMLPRGRDRRTIVLLTFALLFVVTTKSGRAQVVDFQNDRVPMVEIHTLWRFHTGDDPDGKLGWANPNFDDSSWQLLHSDQPLSTQGYPGLSGMAWYRFRVALPASHPPLALFIPGIGTSYEAFAGGQLIGQYGGLPPHERILWSPDGWASRTPALGQVLIIPPKVANGRTSLVIAIRAWQWRDWASRYKPAFEAFSIGDARLMNGLREQRSKFAFWYHSSQDALLLGYMLAALAGLGLFLLRPRESEYLWFAGFELSNVAACALNLYPAFHPVWFQRQLALTGLQVFLGFFCLPFFFVTLLKEKRGVLFWGGIGSAILEALMFVPGVMQWMNEALWVLVAYLSAIPYILLQLLFLTRSARRGNLDARLLLGPFSLVYGVTLLGGLLFGIQHYRYGGSLISFLAGKWETLSQWPFPISVPNLADFLCQISILAILILRFARTRRDEERFKGELEAARTVQQVLIPEEIPAIPGLALECVYKPAGQVGGDFFQILPIDSSEITRIVAPSASQSPEGAGAFRPLNAAHNREGFSPGPSQSALIVIGDVSGKGMPAAMAVSLLVGTVRTLAHYTQSPAEILAAMNTRMLARSKDGFTTCLILRLDPDGAATLANAGHLAPYLAAQEIPVDNGLPLGLAADANYTETTFRLDIDQELTLLTDGIAEARAKTGELFGFERTASISILSAQQIAATAAAFGQQDDITVLKIRRCPVPEPSGVVLAAEPSTSAA